MGKPSTATPARRRFRITLESPADPQGREYIALRRLLKACDGKGFDARRDTALIMLLLDTGARRDELMSRTLGDLDQDLDVLVVLGKGRRERALPYGHKTALGLDRYLRVRQRHKDAHLPWLWLGLRGRLTAWGLVRMLERKPGVAGVETTAKGVRIFAEGTEGLLPEVVQAANPYGLRDMAITETSLETVFI